MIPCHSAALRCTWPFAVTCMTPSSIENEIAHLTVAAFSSHLSRLRREERLVMTAYGVTAFLPLDRWCARDEDQHITGIARIIATVREPQHFIRGQQGPLTLAFAGNHMRQVQGKARAGVGALLAVHGALAGALGNPFRRLDRVRRKRQLHLTI